MVNKFLQIYKKFKDNNGGLFSLIGVSLIILALSAALYVVGDYSSTFYDDGSG